MSDYYTLLLAELKTAVEEGRKTTTAKRLEAIAQEDQGLANRLLSDLAAVWLDGREAA